LWVNGAVVARTSLSMATMASLSLSLPASGCLGADRPRPDQPRLRPRDGRPIRASADDACYPSRLSTTSRSVGARELIRRPRRGTAAYAEARTELVRRFQEAGG
jgi:hypothetical protein